MDVLVKWDKDGSKNVVSSKDLTPLEEGGIVQTGARVKMAWHGKEWWEGTVLDTEEDTDESMHVDDIPDGSDSEDDVPLTKLHGGKEIRLRLDSSTDADDVLGVGGNVISETSERMEEDPGPSEATAEGNTDKQGQDQLSFVNSFVNNYSSSEGQALSPHNNNFVTNSVMSSDTFHTPSFGEDDFEIQPLGQNVGGNDQMTAGFPNQGGGGNGNNGAMNNPNMQHYNTDYQNMSSPNRNSPRMHVTSPPQQMPQSPAMTLPSPSHTMSDNFNTMANQGPQYTNPSGERSFTDALSHMTESMPNPVISQHMPVNPHFPPHNLDIPPITQSNNPNMTQMTQPHQMAPHMSGTFHNMTQAGVTMDPYPIQGQRPVTQLSTINQSAISSHVGLQPGMQPHHQGQMPPPQTGMVKQSPSPPQGTARRSPNQESSEESSDDNTPLAQFAAQKRPVIVEQPKEQPITKKKPPKRKRKKDPNEPQKPVSAYALFFRDTQAAIKGSNPNASFGEVSKIVASMWDSLGVEQKQAYKQRTESAKKEYLKKLAAYRASLVSKAGDMPDLDVESPSKQKKMTAAQMTTIAQPPMGINTAQHLVAHRNIAPRLTGTNVPLTVTMTTATTPMMHQQQPIMHHQMQPIQRVMQGQPMMGQPNSMNPSVCRRNGCNKPTIESPDWDNEYCSNECVVDHCRDVFTAWVATNGANSTTSVLPSIK